MSAVDLSFSDAALDLLDTYLLSDQSPPESMPLSVLDGFLTGIAIGPELVMPSEWLPYVWGGEDLVFDDQAQASASWVRSWGATMRSSVRSRLAPSSPRLGGAGRHDDGRRLGRRVHACGGAAS